MLRGLPMLQGVKIAEGSLKSNYLQLVDESSPKLAQQ
jgi:hypothetical protein